MKVVIQCAASKSAEAGYLRDAKGNNVCFVAEPALAPKGTDFVYARPDDLNGAATWRQQLLSYNQRKSNPFGLLPAWRLYRNEAYGLLVSKLGVDNVFILSAGWGLLRADFLTPCYDITFSNQADDYKKRRNRMTFRDFNQMPDSTDEVLFFGGKDYLPLFLQLTSAHSGKRVVYYNSAHAPEAPGCKLEHYITRTRTNWHYECVKKVVGLH